MSKAAWAMPRLSPGSADDPAGRRSGPVGSPPFLLDARHTPQAPTAHQQVVPFEHRLREHAGRCDCSETLFHHPLTVGPPPSTSQGRSQTLARVNREVVREAGGETEAVRPRGFRLLPDRWPASNNQTPRPYSGFNGACKASLRSAVRALSRGPAPPHQLCPDNGDFAFVIATSAIQAPCSCRPRASAEPAVGVAIDPTQRAELAREKPKRPVCRRQRPKHRLQLDAPRRRQHDASGPCGSACSCLNRAARAAMSSPVIAFSPRVPSKTLP